MTLRLIKYLLKAAKAHHAAVAIFRNDELGPVHGHVERIQRKSTKISNRHRISNVPYDTIQDIVNPKDLVGAK